MPVEHAGERRPGVVRRLEVDLGHHRRPVAAGELEPAERRERVLVGHVRVAELRVRRRGCSWSRTARRSRRTPSLPASRACSRVRRRPCASPPARTRGQRDPVARDQLVVPPLAVDPQPRLHRRVRQPAEPRRTSARSGTRCATRSRRPRSRVRPVVEDRVDLGGEVGALHGHPAVALDEQHAARPCRAGRSAAGSPGRRGRRRRADLARELVPVLDARAHLVDLGVRQPGCARTTRPAAGHELQPGHRAQHPDHGERRQRPTRLRRCRCGHPASRPTASGITTSSATTTRRHRPRRSRPHPSGRSSRPGRRTPGRSSAQSLTGSNGRSITSLKPMSRTFTTSSSAEHEPTRRPPRRRASGRRTRPARPAAAPRPGCARTPPGSAVRARSGATSANHTTGRRHDGERRGRGRHGVPGQRSTTDGQRRDRPDAATATTRRARTTRRAAPARRPAAATPTTAGARSAAATRQHDALDRGDHLAPVPRGRRPAQPGQQPLGRQQRVARQPDGEHPPADRRCDVDAEHQDQEGVDLHVEAGARARSRCRCAGRPGRRRRPARARPP